MYTDPTRLRASDPGHVEGNPVFLYHDVFNPDRDEVEDLKDRYRRGAAGDVEVKQKLATAHNAFLDPIREPRATNTAHKGPCAWPLPSGAARRPAKARQT